MKRNKKKPERIHAILTADWHLRETAPICRVDDFWVAQWQKVDYVAELQERYQCPVLHAGDLFEHWKPSPELLSKTIKHLPDEFYTVYGNHDLPQHNVDLHHRSGIHTLEVAGALQVLVGAHAGDYPRDEHAITLATDDCEIKAVVWHEGVWQGTVPWPGCQNPTAEQVLEDYPQFDLIVTGDFHTPCIEYLDGRCLVNPGNLTRQGADEVDYKPRVYLWTYEDGEHRVIPEYFPVDSAAISREHLERTEEKDRRITAFVERLNTDWETELSFEANLEKFLHTNKLDKRTQEIVRKAVDQDAG